MDEDANAGVIQGGTKDRHIKKNIVLEWDLYLNVFSWQMF